MPIFYLRNLSLQEVKPLAPGLTPNLGFRSGQSGFRPHLLPTSATLICATTGGHMALTDYKGRAGLREEGMGLWPPLTGACSEMT